MSTNFPTTLDTYTDTTPSSNRRTDSLSGRINNLQDALEAAESKIGINSSAVTTSFDYKLANKITTNTLANRPAAGTLGRLFLASDNGQLYLDNGTDWKVCGGGGTELGYTEATSDFTTTSTTFVDVTGMTVNVEVADRPIRIVFHGITFASGLSVADFQLIEDPAGAATAVPFGNHTHSASVLVRQYMARRRAPSAGTHTYKLQAKTSAATLHVGSEANGGSYHYLQVLQL